MTKDSNDGGHERPLHVSLELCKRRRVTSYTLTFKDSPQDGLAQFLSGSYTTVSSLFLNNINTQSIMRMIRCGGLARRRTVAMC